MRAKFLLFLFILFGMGCSSIRVLKHIKPKEHLPEVPKVSVEEAFAHVDKNNDEMISKEEFAAEEIAVKAKPRVQEIDTSAPISIFMWIMGGTCLLIVALKIKPIASSAGTAGKKICEASLDGLTVIKAKFNGLREKRVLPSKERVEDSE